MCLYWMWMSANATCPYMTALGSRIGISSSNPGSEKLFSFKIKHVPSRLLVNWIWEYFPTKKKLTVELLNLSISSALSCTGNLQDQTYRSTLTWRQLNGSYYWLSLKAVFYIYLYIKTNLRYWHNFRHVIQSMHLLNTIASSIDNLLAEEIY